MSQNRFWNLLAKKFSGEAMPEEVQELEKLLRNNPEWVFAAEQIEALWKLQAKEDDRYEAELAFELHLHKQNRNGLYFPELHSPAVVPSLVNPKKFSRFRVIALAVLGSVVLFMSGLTWNNLASKKEVLLKKGLSEVSTKPGSKSKLVLPDSTVVWLNAGSRLTYNEQFGVSNRNTTLTGEAFFDVKKSSVPFIILAGQVHIKVMGTSFNVKSYPNEKTTETTLIRGRVEITLDHRPGEKFILRPNEKLVVSNELEEVKQKQVEKKEPLVVLANLTHTGDNTIIETSWVDNKLVFQDESFIDVARKMERWYGVSIDIRDEKIAQYHLTGTFENETISQALSALQITAPFNFTFSQNKIFITQ
ncbi:MAG: FecR family protein [Flavisolibacter sp.]